MHFGCHCVVISRSGDRCGSEHRHRRNRADVSVCYFHDRSFSLVPRMAPLDKPRFCRCSWTWGIKAYDLLSPGSLRDLGLHESKGLEAYRGVPRINAPMIKLVTYVSMKCGNYGRDSRVNLPTVDAILFLFIPGKDHGSFCHRPLTIDSVI